jgi:hypothetical protein
MARIKRDIGAGFMFACRMPLLVILVLFVSACSLGSAVDADVEDYFEVGDLAANRIILLNILRAKDSAPLHFSELSLVRGSISVSFNGAITDPWGPLLHASSPRRTASIGGAVTTSPSFDVGSLDTQDFTRGVMAKIAPATIKFFLDEGIDYRLVLMLLVSGVRTAGNQEVILNAPESSRQVCYSEDVTNEPPNAIPAHYTIIARDEPCTTGTAEGEFFGFLRVLNHLHRIFAADYLSPPRAIGGPFALDMRSQLRALSGMDPAKFQLRKLPSGQYQLTSTQRQQTVLLCEAPRLGGASTVLTALRTGSEEGTVPSDACVVRTSDAVGASANVPEIAIGLSPGTDVMTLRSTLEVIQYIGRVLTFQEENSRGGTDRCVTLGFEGSNPGCGGNILFHLQHDFTNAQIGLAYRGQYWSVPTARACTLATTCDHTLETTAMIALLLNQNKSAKDIPSTPAFQAVP